MPFFGADQPVKQRADILSVKKFPNGWRADELQGSDALTVIL